MSLVPRLCVLVFLCCSGGAHAYWESVVGGILNAVILSNPKSAPTSNKQDTQTKSPTCKGSDVSRWTNCFGTAAGGGSEYVGEFKDGNFNGQGTYIGANGDKYVGAFKDGKFNGQATYYFLAENQFKGDKYVGEFKDNKRNGLGTYIHINGDKYVGEFKDGKQHGQGTYDFANGYKRVGEFRDGKQHGQGTFTFANGDKYYGEFRVGKAHGEGVHLFSDGRPSQEGVWDDGRFVRAQRIPDHVAGRSWTSAPTHATSQADTGGVALGQSNLTACYTRAAVASWTNCFGAAIYGGGEYVGEFKNGKRHGKGTQTAANGDKYVGEFRDNLRYGQGTVYFANGSLAPAGTWDNDRFVGAGHVPNHVSATESQKPWTSSIITPNRASTAPLAQASRPVEAPRSATPLSLSASASQPSPDGVVTLSITTNNATASLKINGDEEGGRDAGRYSVGKFAQVGENKFEVVAVDRSGNTQRQTVSVVRQPADNVARFAALNPVSLKARPPRDAVAIIIGIQDYRRVSKADFANNDARRFYDYAIRGLGVRPENIKLLLDDKADDIEILGAFKNWLPLKTRKGQTDVYVFYSGHGYPSDDGASLYFLPHGVDRQFLDRSAIKQSDIVQALQAVVPKSVTLFLDACYSGQSRTGETLLAGARPIAIQPKASTFPANFTVLSASAPEQIASSSPELKHGIFSYFLMKGMEGEADQNKDGVITVQEMQSYLSDSVGRKAMSLSRTQQPQVVGDQAKVLVGR